MTKIFVYAANPALAEQTVQTLKTIGAAHAELLETLNIPARQPKENRYLFICETPAEKLSKLAPMVLLEADYAQELGQWYEDQNQIVTTATAQKKRSIVVTSSQLADAKSLLTSINDQWGLNLKAQGEEALNVKNEEPLLAYLVQNLIEQTVPLESLQYQINSLAGIDDEALHEVDALTGYRGLVQQRIELQSQNHQLASTQAELNNQLKDLTEENELLLAQLHTVQEELERIFLESNKFKEDAAKEKADLTAARDAQAKVAADKQKQVESLTKEKADLTAARDTQAKAAAEKQKQVEVLTKEKADLTAARDAQVKATKDATEEADLLLNQLHQVQEELEHYFLKNQEAEAKLDKQQARWQRLLKNHPDYIDTDSTQVELIDPTTQTLKWVVQGMESQEISKDYLEFDTFIESGILGIRFNKTNSRNEPTLNNWPASSEGETIDFIPVGKGTVMRQRALALRELSASDWKLLNTLPQLIKKHLNDSTLDAKLCAVITEGANKLMLGINALPKSFRYDAVTLKSNKVNPDYENLWFELHNASYDTYYWPKFEFRLGAANIKLGKFSNHPKLEIPLIDGKTKPFDSWFEESRDDFGPKWELRFDIEKNILDSSIWERINTNEKNLVKALLNHFAKSKAEYFSGDLNKKRRWEDWANMFEKCSELLSGH